MGNKLPKVGARYKKKSVYLGQPDSTWKISREGETTFGAHYFWMDEIGSVEHDGFSISKSDFWNYFEELPEDKPATSEMERTEKPEQKLPEIGRGYRHKTYPGLEAKVYGNKLSPGKVMFAADEWERAQELLPEDFWAFYEEIEDHKEKEKPNWIPKPEFQDRNRPGISAVDKALEDMKDFFETYKTDECCDGIAVLLWGLAQNLVNALEEEKKIYYSDWQKSECGRFKVRAGTTSSLTFGEKPLDGSTIPQTPVSGISEPTKEIKGEGFAIMNGKRFPFYDFKYGKGEAAKSIWKDVSELPQYGSRIILRIKAEPFYYLDAIWEDGFFEIDESNDFNKFNKIRKEAIDAWSLKYDFLNDYESEKKARIELEERVDKLEKHLGIL